MFGEPHSHIHIHMLNQFNVTKINVVLQIVFGNFATIKKNERFIFRLAPYLARKRTNIFGKKFTACYSLV